jgi:RNAse (barnase) inhibitor barstar
MATFKIRNVEEYQRLDWQILQKGAVSLYTNLDVLEQSCEWFHQNAYPVYLFDASLWRSREDFFEKIGDTLHIEHCNGLDALNDCFASLDIPYESGSVLVFRHFDQFAQKDRSFAQGVLDIIATNSRLFSLHGYRFLALIQVDDSQITFEPIGAQPVMLNPIEWRRRFKTQLTQARG